MGEMCILSGPIPFPSCPEGLKMNKDASFPNYYEGILPLVSSTLFFFSIFVPDTFLDGNCLVSLFSKLTRLPMKGSSLIGSWGRFMSNSKFWASAFFSPWFLHIQLSISLENYSKLSYSDVGRSKSNSYKGERLMWDALRAIPKPTEKFTQEFSLKFNINFYS